MAYQDALFQLGMDLTRSSTAQKEDHGDAAQVVRHVGSMTSREASIERFEERGGPGIAGSHLIVDLFGACRLDDAEHIEQTLNRCVDVSGATLLHLHVTQTSVGSDVSAVAVLDRGHVSIHTDPETGSAALDVFLRGETRPGRCVDLLEKAFLASKVVVRQHQRGDEAVPAHQAAAALRRSPRPRVKVRRAA
jgi:S-adenosylmethionine decarboxylase